MRSHVLSHLEFVGAVSQKGPQIIADPLPGSTAGARIDEREREGARL